MRRRDDSFPALDKRAKVVKLGAGLALIGLCAVGTSVEMFRRGGFLTTALVLGAFGVPMFTYGVSCLVDGWRDYRRYRRLLRDADRDPWDPKTEPAEYGPWRPGDP